MVGYDDVFAAGDAIALEGSEGVAKAGVHAVRAGPVLAANLRAQLLGQRLRPFRPQRDLLSILNLADGTAIAFKWGIAVEGR